MPTFLMISRHSVENCPMNNEKVKKNTLEVIDKMDALTKKHGIKSIGNWSVIPEHLVIQVYDAPSLDALLKFQMEPEVMRWIAVNTTEVKLAMTRDESVKMLKSQ